MVCFKMKIRVRVGMMKAREKGEGRGFRDGPKSIVIKDQDSKQYI